MDNIHNSKPLIHACIFSLPPLDFNPEGDVLVFDKPYRCTSFDLVGKVKNMIRREMGMKLKVGHAGTLDPLATGVLIICVGKMTKQIDQFQAQEKEYTGTLRFGATTPGFDLEKPVDRIFEYEHITEESVRNCIPEFIGEIEQIPPQFSAVKVAGKRAFDYARKGEEAEIKPKKVVIKEFEITRFALPEIDFRIVCSKGTYIRAIARDLGAALNSGAHLTKLRRMRIGDFKVDEAIRVIE